MFRLLSDTTQGNKVKPFLVIRTEFFDTKKVLIIIQIIMFR